MLVFVGLGSNLGERERYLAQAVQRLGRTEGVSLRGRSSLYESAAIGPPQPNYLNAAIEIDTSLDIQQLLGVSKAIEQELGRPAGGPRWIPRTIDIDLLLADMVVAEPFIQVPHLELHKRAFALMPLCEIAPDLTHPVLERTLKSLLAELPDQAICRISDFYVDF